MTRSIPSYAAVWRRLLGRRLARYSDLDREVQYYVSRSSMCRLWQEVFQEEDPVAEYSLLDSESEFAARIDRERFPVDFDALNDYLNSGMDPMQNPIWLAGCGVPWELGCFDDILEYLPGAWPMVAACAIARVPSRSEPSEVVGDDDLVLVEEWWADRGWPDLAALQGRLAWLREPEPAIKRLQRLRAPFDGLATLYQCTIKGTGNPFLDLPSGPWQGEYVADYDYWWDAADIAALTGLYAAVAPAVARLGAYEKWYDQAGLKADPQIAAILTKEA
ncbi:MAG: hypothetical protein KJ734_04495 [Chloroflexi bacterium]|nr:hypothetical protein [Chloroflexota bacterium]